MSINVITNVFCEYPKCTAHEGLGAFKAELRIARKAAKDKGWSRVDGKDYCPAHKPTRVTALTFPASPSDRP